MPKGISTSNHQQQKTQAALEALNWLRDVIAHPEKYNDPSLPFRITVSTFGTDTRAPTDDALDIDQKIS